MSVLDEIRRYRVQQLKAGKLLQRIPPFKLDKAQARLLLGENNSLMPPAMFLEQNLDPIVIKTHELITKAINGGDDAALEAAISRIKAHGVRLKLTEEGGSNGQNENAV